MDFDPLTRDAAPSRYQVESGSEDESPLDEKVEAGDITLQLDASSSSVADRDVVVLVGAAGRAWLEAGSAPSQDGSIHFSGDQQASISSSAFSATAVFVMPSSKLPQTRLAELVSRTFSSLQPKSLIVIDSYSPAAFGYHIDRTRQDSEGIRYLNSQGFGKSRISKSWFRLQAPDAVMGVSAAFLAAATAENVPVLLLQVPDRNPQSHAQLYSAGLGQHSIASARLDETSLHAIDSLVSRSSTAAAGSTSLLDYVRKRRPDVPQESLGDGGMYM